MRKLENETIRMRAKLSDSDQEEKFHVNLSSGTKLKAFVSFVTALTKVFVIFTPSWPLYRRLEVISPNNFLFPTSHTFSFSFFSWFCHLKIRKGETKCNGRIIKADHEELLMTEPYRPHRSADGAGESRHFFSCWQDCEIYFSLS